LLGADAKTEFLSAKLLRDLPANDQRQDYLRARTEVRNGELCVEAFTIQDSSMLSILAKAHALIVRMPNAPAIKAGDPVSLLPLE
jgi:molybdopterin molybdotransferase